MYSKVNWIEITCIQYKSCINIKCFEAFTQSSSSSFALPFQNIFHSIHSHTIYIILLLIHNTYIVYTDQSNKNVWVNILTMSLNSYCIHCAMCTLFMFFYPYFSAIVIQHASFVSHIADSVWFGNKRRKLTEWNTCISFTTAVMFEQR